MADDYLALSGPQRRALLDQCLAIHGWVCCICHLPIGAGEESLQHVVPRSKGGTNAQENLRPAHRVCNSTLGNRSMSDVPAYDGLSFFTALPLHHPAPSGNIPPDL